MEAFRASILATTQAAAGWPIWIGLERGLEAGALAPCRKVAVMVSSVLPSRSLVSPD